MAEESYKILIVDDDDAIRETYVQVFQQKGAEVISAKDGVEGLDLATKEIPDVIMTGIIMPRMDGFQMVQALRENVQTREIPIVVLSHLGREGDRLKAQNLSIDNFIVQGTMTLNEIVSLVTGLTSQGGTFKLSFDPFAWDAPRLAKMISCPNFNCPTCKEKLIMEVTRKQDGKGFDGVLKCLKCDFVA